jgi:hypothetical protein
MAVKRHELWTRNYGRLPVRSGLIFARCAMANPLPPDPTCKAILLCQKTIIENGTDSVSLIAIFDGFLVGDELTTPPAEAFCQITNACGEYHITVRIEDLDQGILLAMGDGGKFTIPDRLTRANIIIPIPAMKFARPGVFDFVVLANGSEIDRQPFRVTKKSQSN